MTNPIFYDKIPISKHILKSLYRNTYSNFKPDCGKRGHHYEWREL